MWLAPSPGDIDLAFGDAETLTYYLDQYRSNVPVSHPCLGGLHCLRRGSRLTFARHYRFRPDRRVSGDCAQWHDRHGLQSLPAVAPCSKWLCSLPRCGFCRKYQVSSICCWYRRRVLRMLTWVCRQRWIESHWRYEWGLQLEYWTNICAWRIIAWIVCIDVLMVSIQGVSKRNWSRNTDHSKVLPQGLPPERHRTSPRLGGCNCLAQQRNFDLCK